MLPTPNSTGTPPAKMRRVGITFPPSNYGKSRTISKTPANPPTPDIQESWLPIYWHRGSPLTPPPWHHRSDDRTWCLPSPHFSIVPITGRPRKCWSDDCIAAWRQGEGKGYWLDRGLERGNAMDVETAWSEIATALLVIVIIMFLLLTY
jgi:hypothetical protein